MFPCVHLHTNRQKSKKYLPTFQSINGKNEVTTGIKVSQRLGQCYNGSIITGCPAVEVITGNSAKNRINRARPGNDSRTGSVMPVEAEKPCISRISGKKKMHGNSIKITVHWWHIYRSWIQCTMFWKRGAWFAALTCDIRRQSGQKRQICHNYSKFPR